MHARSTRLAAMIAIPALLLVGCGEGGTDSQGGDSKAGAEPSQADDPTGSSSEGADVDNPLAGEPPQKVIGLALAETKAANSVRMQLDAASDGWTVDLQMSVDGKCNGTIEEGPKRHRIRSDGTDHFVKGNLAYWKSAMETGKGRAMLDILGDKWAKLVKPANIAPTRELCNLAGWLSALELQPSSFTSEGEPNTLEDGTEAVEFTSSGGQAVWVSVEEPRRILKFNQPGKESVTLSEHDEEMQVKAPPPNQVVELRKQS